MVLLNLNIMKKESLDLKNQFSNHIPPNDLSFVLFFSTMDISYVALLAIMVFEHDQFQAY
jgi:hypothetical protein